MKYISLIFLTMISLQANATEKRCGWLENPTPGNLWLTDSDGSWGILMQGRDTVLSDDEVDKVGAAMKNKQEYVRTNRSYGFSCACMDVNTQAQSKMIIAVHHAEQLPLKTCLEDTAITPKIPLPFK